MSLFKNDDVFSLSEFDSKITPDEDPFLRNIDQVLSAITKTFLNKLPLFISLFIRQSKQLFSRFNISLSPTGDRIFNSLRQASKKETNIVFSDDEFRQICICLINNCKPYLLRSISSSIEDDEEKAFEITKWLFIPMRINVKTIPEDEKHILMKSWFSTIFTLPLWTNYLTSYSKAYPNVVKSALSFQHGVINKDLEPNVQIIDKLSTLSGDTIDAAISTIRKTDNPTFTLIRTFMIIVLITSTDILRKLCPNISACISICPNYDGGWLDPLDSLVSQQITKIGKLIERLE